MRFKLADVILSRLCDDGDRIEAGEVERVRVERVQLQRDGLVGVL